LLQERKTGRDPSRIRCQQEDWKGESAKQGQEADARDIQTARRQNHGKKSLDSIHRLLSAPRYELRRALRGCRELNGKSRAHINKRMISRILKHLGLTVLRIYRLTISPYHPPVCRFTPTCSAYAEAALREHGPFRGTWMAIRRLLRCHPFSRGGYDPVR
jgi:putative membrane protein insertion efficiency factor